jgi:rRNA maturation endonuclease Nob1
MAINWSGIRSWFGRPKQECPECHSTVSKAEAFCDVCGYDIVRNAKSSDGPRAAH